jgi:uncharacterized protein YceH (UPF0502 family)
MSLLLDPIEVRVLGALIEKSLLTPDVYPLSLNALVAACNQKTSREPVTDYPEATVRDALEQLRDKRLVVEHLGARAHKYQQTISLMSDMTPAHCALLAVLMLRGPQTAGDLRQRCERMAEFADLAAVQQGLEALAARQPPLVAALPRRPGEKEQRWLHLLGADRPEAHENHGDSAMESEVPKTDTRRRLEALEAELAQLKAEFAAFRKQFE